MQKSKKKLAENTFFLYLLTFSNFLFSFITIPYQTRVLGPEVFGVIGFAMAFYMYFSVIIDFGFILSATKSVTENKDDVLFLSQKLTSVTIAKTFLFIICFFFLCIITEFIPKIEHHFLVIFCFLLLAYLTSLTPDFIYRGLENMKVVTLRAVAVRLIFALLLFAFLKHPSQYLMVPLFQVLGVIASLFAIYFDMYKRYQIRFGKTNIVDIIGVTRDSSQYFLSRIASTVYGVTNNLIIGLMYPTEMLGYYSSAEKFKSIANSVSTPIADSLYPYMIRTGDYKMLIRIVCYLEIIVAFFCLVLSIYSIEFCVFLFGSDYGFAGKLLYYFIPLLLFVLPNYVFGFPALTPLNQQKWANWSVEIAMVVQIFGITFLYLYDSLSIYTLCVLTIISEFTCVSIRIFVFGFYLKKNKL